MPVNDIEQGRLNDKRSDDSEKVGLTNALRENANYQGGHVTINISANVNNYGAAADDVDLTHVSTVLWNCTTAATVTGILKRRNNHRLRHFNVGTAELTLSDADSGSDAANRLTMGRNAVLKAGEGGLATYYDETNSTWRAYGGLGKERTTNNIDIYEDFMAPIYHQSLSGLSNVDADTTAGLASGLSILATWDPTAGQLVSNITAEGDDAARAGGTGGDLVLQTWREGIYRFATFGATGHAGVGNFASEATSGKGSFFLGDGPIYFCAHLRISGNLSDASQTFIVRAGIGDRYDDIPDNGTFFTYTHSAGSGKWQAINRYTTSSVPTTRTTLTSNTTVAVDQFYKLEIIGQDTDVFTTGATADGLVGFPNSPLKADCYITPYAVATEAPGTRESVGEIELTVVADTGESNYLPPQAFFCVIKKTNGTTARTIDVDIFDCWYHRKYGWKPAISSRPF